MSNSLIKNCYCRDECRVLFFVHYTFMLNEWGVPLSSSQEVYTVWGETIWEPLVY